MAYVRKKDNFQNETITVLLFVAAIGSFETCPAKQVRWSFPQKCITQFKSNDIFEKIATSNN